MFIGTFFLRADFSCFKMYRAKLFYVYKCTPSRDTRRRDGYVFPMRSAHFPIRSRRGSAKKDRDINRGGTPLSTINSEIISRTGCERSFQIDER